MTTVTARPVPPVPGASAPAAPEARYADLGDEVYYRHPQHGVTHGKVIAHGQHGATCRHGDGQAHQVLWSDLLGHRKRRERAFTVVDRGEDGAIVADERGQHHFLAGDLPADEAEEDETTAPPDPLAKAQPLLVDVGALSCGCTDHALEILHKALSEDQADIWAPHENPWIRELIERLTAQGLEATEALQQAVMAWLKGSVPTASPAPRPDLLAPWTEALTRQVRAYLHGKPQADWTASDWSLLVDYLIRQHLPGELLRNALATASQQGSVLGAVSVGIKMPLTPAEVVSIDTLLQAARRVLARTQQAEHLTQAVSLARLNQIQMDYAQAHAAELIVDFTDDARRAVKRIVLEHAKQAALAGISPTANAKVVEQQLRDKLGELNRDWRRIALTEVGEAANQGLIASLPLGSHVRRVEMYRGACAFCRQIDGLIVQIVSPDQEDKDWDTQIWVGKTNVGRSASPRKRVGDVLVERTDSELWKPAAGLMHPHCRGRWVPLDSQAQRDELTRWLFTDGAPAPGAAADPSGVARPDAGTSPDAGTPGATLPPGADPAFAAFVQAQLRASRPQYGGES